jgi:broad specificity phosphatase PhoE
VIDALFLIRHGETVHNVAGIAQGWNDSALSDNGTRQVERLATRIASLAPTELYSSPLGRALTTAQLIGDVSKLEVTPIDDLREMSYGKWEGRSFLDVRRDFAEDYERWIADADHPCPEGESHNDVLHRMQRAFSEIESRGNGRGRRVVIVTHGTAIRIGATALLNIPVGTARQFAVDNASINLFIHRGERYVLKLWNDTTHCGDAFAT